MASPMVAVLTLRPAPSDVTLRPVMRRFGALLITLSALSPGIGLFIVGSDLLHQAGTATLLCFVAAVLLGTAMACVYAELGSAFPDTGAEYTICGRVLGPTPGFSILALVLVGFSLAQALIAQGVVGYLHVLWPTLPALATSLVMILAVTVIAVMNIRVNALVTGIFLAAELASLVLVAALGFMHPVRSLLPDLLQPVMADGHGGLAGVPLAVIGVAAAGGIYAFNGYGSVVGLGEEMHEARRGVALVVFGALGLATLMEMGPLAAILVGADHLSQTLADAAPVSAFVRERGGAAMANVMSLAVALAMFNSMIAVALLAGRMVYATGRDRLWPPAVSLALASIHPRFASPWIATLLMGAISLIWCFAPEHVLVLVLGNGNVALYAALCLATVVGRRTGSTAGAGWRMPLFPLAPALALVALAAIVWADLTDSGTGRLGLAITGAILVAAALIHVVMRKTARPAAGAAG